jgi:hypothetical protein
MLDWHTGGGDRTRAEAAAMGNLYRTSNEAKTLEIEDTNRTGHPFRLVVTLRKLNMVSMLDYFLTEEESRAIVKTLTEAKEQVS